MNEPTAAFRDMWNTMINYLPNIIGALLLLLVAWVVAIIVRMIVTRGFKKVGGREALVKGHMATDIRDANEKLNSVGKIFYYLVFLLFLPSVLATLNMGNVAGPITNMMDQMLAFLPNLLMAVIILTIGFFVAKFVKTIVATLFATMNIDKWFNKLTKKTGSRESVDPAEQNKLANVLGSLAFVIVLIPIVTIALETLNIQTISEPIVGMLDQVLNMIPNILVGIVLILAGVLIAKFVGDLLINLLKGTGINNFSDYLNADQAAKAPSLDLATIIGRAVQTLIIIFFTVEAFNVLQLDVLNSIGESIITYLPLLISALIILGIGLIGGRLLGNYVAASSGNRLLGAIVKYVVIIIAVFMTLDQLNFASSIVNLAFLFILAGLAVAFTIAFGLGGREFAKKQLDRFEAKAKEEDEKPNL